MYCHRSLEGYNWGESGMICTATHPETGGDVAFFDWALQDDAWVLIPRPRS